MNFSLLTVYYEHKSDILPIIELDGRSLSPQQRREERYWEISKLTYTKIHRHGIAWRIHAIASIRNRAGKRTRVLPTASGSLHPLCAFARILCRDSLSRKARFIRRPYIQCRSTKKLQGQLISALVNICSLCYLHNLFHTSAARRAIGGERDAFD